MLVLFGGNNYLYAEAGLVNPWKYGLSDGVSYGVGGVAGNELGTSIENSYPSTTKYGLGVVWDFKNQEFNIFRDCKDFNEFINSTPVEMLDCNKPEIQFTQIRNAIYILK